MIIDTDKLREKLDAYYAERCRKIDENVKNDRRAIAMFTQLETQQIKQLEDIDSVEKLFSFLNQ